MIIDGGSRLTLSCVFASFCMLSNVYFSDLLWRILKSREPLLDNRDNSSNMMSLGMLSFFPRSIKSPVWKKTLICSCSRRGKKTILFLWLALEFGQFYRRKTFIIMPDFVSCWRFRVEDHRNVLDSLKGPRFMVRVHEPAESSVVYVDSNIRKDVGELPQAQVQRPS